MKFRMIFVAALLLAVLAALWLWLSPRPEAMVTAARRATVTIHVLVPEPSHEPGSGGLPILYRASNGSGFFIDDQGHIVTNAHVVEGVASIEVELADGRRLPATVIGSDRLTDVAVIQVAARDVPALRFAERQPEIGERVFTIGAPFGLDGSVSTGIVAGLHRAIRPSAPDWLLQHTALIDPGSSGGPLLNARGEVIGINSSLPDSQFNFSSIAFAIEAPVVARISRDIIAGGRVRRADFGMTLHAAEPQLALALRLPAERTILIDEVAADGAAASAGLRAGDRLVGISGQPVTGLSATRRLLALSDPSLAARITVERGGRKLSFTVQPKTVEIRSPARPAAIAPTGLTFAAAGPAQIAAVAPRSPAAAAGLRAGDLVMEIGLQPVTDSADARRRLQQPQRFTALTISRPGLARRLVVIGSDIGAYSDLEGNDRGVLSADV